jgi:hypothetical protein
MFSDKNSLFDRGSLGEMGVCVNGNVYTPYWGWGLGANIFKMSGENEHIVDRYLRAGQSWREIGWVSIAGKSHTVTL